jgi:hypothetical protein
MVEDGADSVGRSFVASRAEELLGRLARGVLDNPTLGGAIGRALDARSRAAQAQEAAMGLLNVPTAGDIERLTRRVRAIGERLGGIEDALARLEGAQRRGADQLAQRLDGLEKELAAARRALADIELARPDDPPLVSRDQQPLELAARGR